MCFINNQQTLISDKGGFVYAAGNKVWKMQEFQFKECLWYRCNMIGTMHAVHMRQGNLIFFKVRELSGNFMICQGNMKYCQNITELSGNFTFQSCKSLDVWSWCTVLVYISCLIFNANIVREIWIYVREKSGNFVLSSEWEPQFFFIITPPAL